MSIAEPQPTSQAAASAVPDYLTSPDAVLKDVDASWRYGQPPDYSKTRKYFEETKRSKHEAGSLPELVQNLVKNWEIEASFKPSLADWRTVDHKNYSFAINGGEPQTAEHMLKVGTYNAIITSNEYYSPKNSDFASSHKTFKRMMPTFAWEVLEVYSGPPVVAFKWRHWGQMVNDYVGFNDKGERISAKAHRGMIDIQGVTVAKVDDQVRVQKLETWFDPLEMFRQIAPTGIVNKQIIAAGDSGSTAIVEDVSLRQTIRKQDGTVSSNDTTARAGKDKGVASTLGNSNKAGTGGDDAARRTADNNAELLAARPDADLEATELAKQQAQLVPLEPRDQQHLGNLSKDVTTPNVAGEAVAEASDGEHAQATHEEMSKITPMQCPFMNGE